MQNGVGIPFVMTPDEGVFEVINLMKPFIDDIDAEEHSFNRVEDEVLPQLNNIRDAYRKSLKSLESVAAQGVYGKNEVDTVELISPILSQFVFDQLGFRLRLMLDLLPLCSDKEPYYEALGSLKDSVAFGL